MMRYLSQEKNELRRRPVVIGFYLIDSSIQITIEECYKRYYAELVQLVEYIVHHHDLSEDIVQNLFVELLQSHSMRKVMNLQHLKQYFRLAARCRAYDWLRLCERMRIAPTSGAVPVPMLEADMDPENHIMLVEQIQKIEIFLAMQQVRNRKIFLLYLSGIGVRSLAQIFGIATTTVYAILGKMRRSLKVFLHMEEKAQ